MWQQHDVVLPHPGDFSKQKQESGATWYSSIHFLLLTANLLFLLHRCLGIGEPPSHRYDIRNTLGVRIRSTAFVPIPSVPFYGYAVKRRIPRCRWLIPCPLRRAVEARQEMRGELQGRAITGSTSCVTWVGKSTPAQMQHVLVRHGVACKWIKGVVTP